MKRSLEDFRKRLIKSISIGMVLVWFSFTLLFQSLVFLLAENQKTLADNRLSGSLNSFVSSYEGKVAIIASHPEFRTFLRSSEESRAHLTTSVLTLLSTLRDEDVVGVSLVDSTKQPLVSEVGDTQGQVLGFELCYIGDQLNAQFGRCAASVLLYFAPKVIEKVLTNIEQLVPCVECRTPISQFLADAQFLKISQYTSFDIHYAATAARLGIIEFYFFIISMLLVGFGIFFTRLVGRSIKQDIVDPLNALLTQLEKGRYTELSTNDSIEEVVALHRHNSALSAVARTTQMLAHDVRKPFHLFRMTLDRLRSARSESEFKQFLSETLPEVDRSLARVNGLISDVLNVGGKASLILSPVCLWTLVDDVCGEIRLLFPNRAIDFEIAIPKSLWVNADADRLSRVFLNIFSNAVEAVPENCVHLWAKIETVPKEKDQDSLQRITLRVGNSGSFVSEEAREKLFDLFYTSGKKGGTGLGLAIVQKIVLGHGSQVRCESERNSTFPKGKVEFVWTMDCITPPVTTEMTLTIEKLGVEETPVFQSSTTAERPKVLFLDDSPLARLVWEAKLKKDVDFQSFDGPTQFNQAIENGEVLLEEIHTVITDYFFAAGETQNGLDLAASLRARGFRGRIFLASNGEFSSIETDELVDKIIDKNPAAWNQLG